MHKQTQAQSDIHSYCGSPARNPGERNGERSKTEKRDCGPDLPTHPGNNILDFLTFLVPNTFFHIFLI